MDDKTRLKEVEKIANRIKAEYRKHGKGPSDWSIIAAKKLTAEYMLIPWRVVMGKVIIDNTKK